MHQISKPPVARLAIIAVYRSSRLLLPEMSKIIGTTRSSHEILYILLLRAYMLTPILISLLPFATLSNASFAGISAPTKRSKNTITNSFLTRRFHAGSRSRLSMSTPIDNARNVMETLPPKQLVGLGMQRFRTGDVIGSIEAFDLAERKDASLRPFLWQRGLSYYYADMFQMGSDQFRFDVSVNPLDVEEIVWDIACIARMSKDGSIPKEKMMALPKGRTDRRKIMATVYSLFRGDGAMEADLAAAGGSSDSEEFYAKFYLGLYAEANGELSKASHYMSAAACSRYAKGVGAVDYMTSCAKVHCKLRGWVYA